MILRAFRKQKDNPVGLRAQDIGALATFASLPPQMLQTIAEHSGQQLVSPGKWAPDTEDDNCYFLANGTLQLLHDGKDRLKLTPDSPGTGYPLPAGPHWQVIAQTDASLLRVPRRYLELTREQKAATEDKATGGIELHEDDNEAQLYLEFHQMLKAGKYELPVMPDLAVRIGKAIDDPDTDNEDIARLIQLDPAVSARVMSVVNSAAFAGTTVIRSLQQAVARLGRQQVRNLVYSCIIKDLFRTESSMLKNSMKALWNHSCRVAAISSVLARYTPGLDPDRALLAGLVHDIGIIPLLQTARTHPRLAQSATVLEHLIDELKAEVGRLTLQAWHFDDELSGLAAHAEDWFRLGTAAPDYLDVVLVAQLHAFAGQPGGRQLPRIDQIPPFHRLALGKLTPRHSIAILDKAAREIDEVEQLLH